MNDNYPEHSLIAEMGNGTLRDNDYIIKKSFTRYLIPSILSILGGNISIMIDSLIAGRFIGSGALAAMSIVSSVFFVITTVGVLINGGSSTIASIAIGKKDTEAVNQCFSLAVLLTACTSILLSLVGILLLDPIVTLLCRDMSLRDMTREYCLALIPGAVCIMAVYVPLNFLRIVGRGKIGMIMFMIMSGLDIILDLLFVAIFDWGMFGLGLATIVSSAAAVLICFPFLMIKGGQYRFTNVKNAPLVLKIAVIGSPMALNNFYSVIRVIVLNACLINVGGAVAVAAFSFANSVNVVAQAVISGVSQTVSPLTGVLHGEKDIVGIKKLIKHACRIGFASIGVYIIGVTAFADPLCRIFGLPDSARETAGAALVICAVSLAPAIINNIFIYYFMTIGKTRLANKLTFARGFLLVIIFAYLFSSFAGVYGVWFSFLVAESLTVLTVWYLTHVERKRSCKKSGAVLDGVLLLNMEEIKDNKVFSFAVVNRKDAVMESSNKVTDFCGQCGMSPKQSMLVSLSIEEILLLMTDHAFTDGKEHYIDVRIVFGDMIVMRFRCDGNPFNPLDYYRNELANKEFVDYGESLGINMLLKVVKKIDYTTTLGLNNMIVEI